MIVATTTVRSLAAVLALALGLAGAQAQAQIPKTFTNLQVLPKDISKQELVGTMRDWAGALGVRCAFCHVGPDDLEGMDFASDKRRDKLVAREMLKMTRAIAETLKALPPGEEPSQHVSCFTCHRGLRRPPRDLRELIGESVAQSGVAAGLQRYRDLRADELAKGRYDFSDASLNAVARRLVETGKLEEARAVLQANLEYYPASAEAQAVLGQAFLAAGDKAQARSAFQKALQLDPNDRGARHFLHELDEPDGPQPSEQPTASAPPPQRDRR